MWGQYTANTALSGACIIYSRVCAGHTHLFDPWNTINQLHYSMCRKKATYMYCTISCVIIIMYYTCTMYF